MILFLNFAPLSYGGGAERWITSVANQLSSSEEVNVIQVNRNISNIYARIVLKREFDERMKTRNDKFKLINISWLSFIPFSNQYKIIKKEIVRARVIYTKLELNEILILYYFGGTKVLNKTVIGVHSLLRYKHLSLSKLEKIHNFIYSSLLIKFFLKKVYKIHCLHKQQEIEVKKLHEVNNTYVIPNFVNSQKKFREPTQKNLLKIAFVGEITIKKGADILLKIIKRSPQNYIFNIIGEGNIKKELINLNLPQIHIFGYLDSSMVENILSNSDVLLITSRAESFSLASLEALSHGLIVVGSEIIDVDILKNYLWINRTNKVSNYLDILNKIYLSKSQGHLTNRKKAIWQYINKTLSKNEIMNLLKIKLFETKLI